MEAAGLPGVDMASMLGAVGAGGNTGPHLFCGPVATLAAFMSPQAKQC